MREKPILFSAPMVRAILSGAKTQTRRVCKLDVRACMPEPELRSLLACCPYGVPGDRLWVRETWAVSHAIDHLKPREVPQGAGIVYYAATENTGGLLKRPSIFMPRWASRMTIEITDVRVERLQDISEADAIAEGVDRFPGCRQDDDAAAFNRIGPVDMDSFPIARYAVLWEQINGLGSWSADPWVWVVEFRRIAPGEAVRLAEVEGVTA